MTDDQQQWTSTEDQAPPPAPSGATGATGATGGWSSTDDHAPDPRFSTAELGPYFQPDFETTVYGKMPPPEPDDFVHNWMINPFKQTAASLAEAHANAAHLGSNIAGFLDNASNWVHQKTGLPYGHSMQYVKNMFDEMHNEAQGVASNFSGNRQDMPSRIIRGVGNVAFNLPAYVLATQTLGPIGGMALMGGLENLDKGAGATLQGAAEGGALGAAMWVMGPMGRLVRLNGNALLNYFYSKWKGADDDTALMNAGIGGLVGMLPGKQPYPEWWTNRFKIPPLTSPEDIQSQAYMGRLGIETPFWMGGKSPAAEQFGASVMRSPGGGYLARQLDIGKQKLIGAGEAQAAEIGPPATEATAGTAVKEQIGNVLAQQKAELGARLGPESTPLEAGTAAQQRIATDLENTKQTIAAQVHPETQTPLSAGQKTLDLGKAKIREHDKAADAAYGNAWKVEQVPANIERVPMRGQDGGILHDEDGNVITEKIPLPLDGSDVQQALIPFAKRYERTLSDTDARMSLGLKTMRNIIADNPVKSTRDWETDLGTLKEAARTEKGMMELRDPSAGLAAASVAQLQNAIDARMAGAAYPGWDGTGTSPALTHLQEGRKQTALKHDVADVFSGFGNRNLEKIEPMAPYTGLTWGRDTGINRLRNVAGIVPDAIPAIGRAFIESDGDVNQLGPETRKILFRTPEINRALDQYQAAKTRFAPFLRQEPVAAFNQLTQPGGRRINLLSDVAKAAPEQVPAIARAFIDNDGNWGRLDPQTKLQLARDPQLVQDLDKYYALHEKYGDLHKMEPVAVHNLLTAPGGRRLEFLNDVATHAPEQMPLVARAYFEGLLKKLTRKGDITNVDSTINSYLDMDAHTKRLLINNPGQQRDWDSFFFALRRMMHNPNPSGSGFMMGINQFKGGITRGLGLITGGLTGAHTGGMEGAEIGAGLGLMAGQGLEVLSNAALARMMYNKAFIRMVTHGIERQNAGDLPGARLAARTAADMLNKEPPEDPHGGPPTGGGSPSGPGPAGGAPPSLRDIARRGFGEPGLERPVSGSEWDERTEEMARRGITKIEGPPANPPGAPSGSEGTAPPESYPDFLARMRKEQESAPATPSLRHRISSVLKKLWEDEEGAIKIRRKNPPDDDDYTKHQPPPEGEPLSPYKPLQPEEKSLEFLRRAANRDPAIGSPDNERTVFKDANGRFVVGKLTFRDWMNRVEENLTPDEMVKARRWYRELEGFFREHFGEAEGPKMALAWLSSQQNVSPSGGMMNVLRAIDQLRGLPADKTAGLAEEKILDALRGKVPPGGYAQKLHDFVDSALGKRTRTWMGDDPRGGPPAVIDVWANRDVGKVDQKVYDYLKDRFGSKAVKNLKIDGKNVSETDYEYGSKFYNDLVDHLNSIKYDGGEWNGDQVQAVGWVGMQKAMGDVPEFASDLITKNTRQYPWEVEPGEGAPILKQYPWHTLSVDQQAKISDYVGTRATDLAAKLTGVKITNRVVTRGAYQGKPTVNIQMDVFGSPESFDDFARAAGYLGQQTEVWNVRKLKSGNSWAWFIRGDKGLETPELQQQFWQKLRDRVGSRLVPGFSPLSGVDGNGVMIVNPFTQEYLFQRQKAGLKSDMPMRYWTAKDKKTIENGIKDVAGEMGLDLNVDFDKVDLGATFHNWAGKRKLNGHLQGLVKTGRSNIAETLSNYAPSALQSWWREAWDQFAGRGSETGIQRQGISQPSPGQSPPGGTGPGQEATLKPQDVLDNWGSVKPGTVIDTPDGPATVVHTRFDATYPTIGLKYTTGPYAKYNVIDHGKSSFEDWAGHPPKPFRAVPGSLSERYGITSNPLSEPPQGPGQEVGRFPKTLVHLPEMSDIRLEGGDLGLMEEIGFNHAAEEGIGPKDARKRFDQLMAEDDTGELSPATYVGGKEVRKPTAAMYGAYLRGLQRGERWRETGSVEPEPMEVEGKAEVSRYVAGPKTLGPEAWIGQKIDYGPSHGKVLGISGDKARIGWDSGAISWMDLSTVKKALSTDTTRADLIEAGKPAERPAIRPRRRRQRPVA